MAVMKVTAADVKRLQAENAALRQQVQDAAAARAELSTEIKSLRTAMQVETHRREGVENTVTDLKGRLAAVPAQIAELQAGEGPRPDEPRWLYSALADDPVNSGRLFANLDEENAAHVESPNTWFPNTTLALARKGEIAQEAVDPGDAATE